MECATCSIDNCDTIYCGSMLPYMYYDGDSFCAKDANVKGRWLFVDYSIGGTYNNDPSISVACST